MGKKVKKKVDTIEKSTSSSTAKTVGLVMIIMLVGKITGLFRDILLNNYIALESIERTALDPALQIPTNFLDFAFAAAMSSSFIPVFNSYLEKKGKKEAFNLANGFITLMLLFSLIFVALGIVFAPQLISFFTPGITNVETIALAVKLLRIMLPTITLTAVAFSLTGVLQSLGEFNIPAAMSVISNLIIIAFLFLFYDSFGVVGLVITFVIGWVTQILIQLPSLIKKGYIFVPSFDFKNPGLKEIFLLMLPVMVSTWVQPVNTSVNKNIASNLFDGAGMNFLTPASGLYSVITGVFILSIANVIFPKLAKLKATNQQNEFSGTIRETLRFSSFILIPMCVGLVILSEPLIRLVYERGAFTPFATEQTSIALLCYSIGMVGLGFQTILSRAFYASKDAKTPLITGIIAMIINFVFSKILIEFLGVGGPALASSISINVVAIVMLVVQIRRDKNTFDTNAIKAFVKMCIAAAVMGMVVYIAKNLLPSGVDSGFMMRTIIVVVPVVVGVIVYFAMAFILKIDEARDVVSIVSALVRKMKSGGKNIEK